MVRNELSILAKRLKQTRKQKGLTQLQVAAAMSVEIGTLSGYERGYRKPNTDMLLALATFYNVPTDYLLGKTDDPVDYEDPDLVADIPYDVQKHFDDDIKGMVGFQKAREEDVLNEDREVPKDKNLSFINSLKYPTGPEATIEFLKAIGFTEESAKGVYKYMEFTRQQQEALYTTQLNESMKTPDLLFTSAPEKKLPNTTGIANQIIQHAARDKKETPKLEKPEDDGDDGDDDSDNTPRKRYA